MNNNYQLQTLQHTPIGIRTLDTPRRNDLAELTFAMAERSAVKDTFRTVLAKQAMDNTAFLATIEEYYSKLVPNAREDFRFIVETYARLAMLEIVGGDF